MVNWNSYWSSYKFLQKNGFNIAIAILGFVFLFKIGEAFLGRMSVIFYKEIGFTKSDIALYSKGLGWVNNCNFHIDWRVICNSFRSYKGDVCFWNINGIY